MRFLTSQHVNTLHVSQVLRDFTNVSALCHTACSLAPGIVGLGHTECRQMTAYEVATVLNYCPSCHVAYHAVSSYKRIIVYGKLISTIGYSESFRHCDSYISTGSFDKVYKFAELFQGVCLQRRQLHATCFRGTFDIVCIRN